MKTYTLFVGLSITLFSLMLAACTPVSPTPTPGAIFTTVSEGTLKKGDAIPVPAGDAILTVTGNIGTSNIDAEQTVQMDIAALESMGLVEYSVKDPFEQKDIVYRGVLMSKLLEVLQVPSTAKTLHMVALNDYAVDVPIEDMYKYPVLLALQADGEYMPISTRGPAMLVYPYDDFTFDQAVYNDYWIWQIASIDVR